MDAINGIMVSRGKIKEINKQIETKEIEKIANNKLLLNINSCINYFYERELTARAIAASRRPKSRKVMSKTPKLVTIIPKSVSAERIAL